MTDESVLSLVEEILELESGTVSAADDLEELGWDSLSDLSFIAIADERFHVTIDPKQLAAVETPADLAPLLPTAA